METIEYKGIKITPIMKPMLVWDDDETKAGERFVYAKEEPSDYPFIGQLDDRWKNAKPIPKQTIEISIKINGKEAKLSDISEDTLLEVKNFINLNL